MKTTPPLPTVCEHAYALASDERRTISCVTGRHERDHDVLWRDFPKAAIEFERRFASEADCRAYWIEVRWGGKPACAACQCARVWAERDGTLFECADCGHQTSLTFGTLLEGTRKPLKIWSRAVFEIAARRKGISAKELQRIMGLGSCRTAWIWLHKLRAALAPEKREALGPVVEMDEAPVGGKGAPHKQLIMVAGCVSITPTTTMRRR